MEVLVGGAASGASSGFHFQGRENELQLESGALHLLQQSRRKPLWSVLNELQEWRRRHWYGWLKNARQYKLHWEFWVKRMSERVSLKIKTYYYWDQQEHHWNKDLFLLSWEEGHTLPWSHMGERGSERECRQESLLWFPREKHGWGRVAGLGWASLSNFSMLRISGTGPGCLGWLE